MKKQYKIKAPQKALVSSWVSEPFAREKKAQTVIKRSLGRCPKILVVERGSFTIGSSLQQSNVY